MICPKCRKKSGDKFKFCPYCGEPLENLDCVRLTIVRKGQRFDNNPPMTIFIDDDSVYHLKSGEKIVIKNMQSGWHSIKFAFKVREKTIDLNITQNQMIEVEYNSLSGLIETILTPRHNYTVKDGKVTEVENAASAATEIDLDVAASRADAAVIAEMRANNNKPVFEIKTTTGFLSGELVIYADRAEFVTENKNKSMVLPYLEVRSVEKKMGNIDIVGKDDSHNIFVIPREKFSDVFIYLNEHIKALSQSEEQVDDENLRKLKALYDEGILTREEYETKKKQILGL